MRHYGANRDLLLNGLRAIGIDRLAPTDGAFSSTPTSHELTGASLSFCKKLLAATGVAIAPGIDFDTAREGRMSGFPSRADTRRRGGGGPNRHLASVIREA